MCRRILNTIAFVIAGLTLNLCCTASCGAATSTTSVKAMPPYSMGLIDAVIIWHKMKEIPIESTEFAKLYSKELEYHNEFQQRQRIKEVNEKHKNLENKLLSVSTFTFTIALNLKDYNFEKGYFPVDVKPGELLTRIGTINFFHDETKPFDKFMLHYDRIALEYAVALTIPDNFDKIEITQDKAEKLLEQLDSNRTINCVFTATVANATESSAVKSSDGFDALDDANLVKSKKVFYRELGIKQLTVVLEASKGVSKEQPEQILKTWPAASI